MYYNIKTNRWFQVNNIIAEGVTKFSLDLDRAIYNSRDNSAASHRENTIFSPLSISVALSMVLLGSAGSTFNEVSRVLGLEAGVDISEHSEIVHQMFGLLLNIVNYRVEGSNQPHVFSANGIFVQVLHSQRFAALLLLTIQDILLHGRKKFSCSPTRTDLM